MLIRVGYDIEIFCAEPVELVALLDPHPDLAQQIISRGSLHLLPPVASHSFTDPYGNQPLRMTAPAGLFRMCREWLLSNSGEPDPWDRSVRETPVPDLPDAVLVYLRPSRYCETDLLMDRAWSLFGQVTPGWARVRAIFDYVNSHLTFGYAHARATRTASEALEEQRGVCRDFAHLAVTLCRCMNIPARYVNGYLGDIGVPPDPAPMDYNAWCEVWLDGRWHTLDARHNCPRIGRIVVSRGRDAADVPLIHSYGRHELRRFKVWTEEADAAILSDTSDGDGTCDPSI